MLQGEIIGQICMRQKSRNAVRRVGPPTLDSKENLGSVYELEKGVPRGLLRLFCCGKCGDISQVGTGILSGVLSVYLGYITQGGAGIGLSWSLSAQRPGAPFSYIRVVTNCSSPCRTTVPVGRQPRSIPPSFRLLLLLLSPLSPPPPCGNRDTADTSRSEFFFGGGSQPSRNSFSPA
jgi:hypothetical protein